MYTGKVLTRHVKIAILNKNLPLSILYVIKKKNFDLTYIHESE